MDGSILFLELTKTEYLLLNQIQKNKMRKTLNLNKKRSLREKGKKPKTNKTWVPRQQKKRTSQNSKDRFRKVLRNTNNNLLGFSTNLLTPVSMLILSKIFFW